MFNVLGGWLGLAFAGAAIEPTPTASTTRILTVAPAAPSAIALTVAVTATPRRLTPAT